MTLFLRFSSLLYVSLILLHGFAATAIAISALNDPAKAVLAMALIGSLHSAHQYFGPGGKKRWQQCQLGEASSILVSTRANLNCKAVSVSYFSEYLIILAFETAEKSGRNYFRGFHSLVIAPDSLSSKQQGRLRRFLLFGRLVYLWEGVNTVSLASSAWLGKSKVKCRPRLSSR